MTHDIIPEGSLVRITSSAAYVETPQYPWPTATINEYIPAEQTEDGKAFYIASAGTDNYNNVDLWPEHLVIEKTVTEMNAREIPSATTILDAISSNLLDSYFGFELSETFASTGEIEVFGETDDGLSFGFTLVISGLDQTSF